MPLSPRNDERRNQSELEPRGATHAWSVIFWLLEQRWPTLLALPAVIALLSTMIAGGGWLLFGLTLVTLPPLALGLASALLVCLPRRHDGGVAAWEDMLAFRDPKENARYAGKKIPMEI